ncbi:MAG TPA: hypothetical protein VH250_01495 [Granulicella sp.]|jgi:hypothetical protein|nr:hypothetical protein [Granulicella sp.]
MLKLPTLLTVLSLALVPALPAAAQLGLSGSFTVSRLSHPVGAVSSPTTLYGETVSVYYQRGTFFAYGGDARASFLGGSGISLNSGAIGPRVAFKPPAIPLQIYGEALGGFTSYTGGPSANSISEAEYQLLVGGDYTLLPHIDWRVVEYTYTSASNSLSSHSLSTGIVVRLP